MRRPAIEVEGFWMVAVEPVRKAYTLTQAAHILRRRRAVLQDMVDTSKILFGPASTKECPVDHEALSRYLERRRWERERSELFSATLGLLGEWGILEEADYE